MAFEMSVKHGFIGLAFMLDGMGSNGETGAKRARPLPKARCKMGKSDIGSPAIQRSTTPESQKVSPFPSLAHAPCLPQPCPPITHKTASAKKRKEH